MADLEYPMAVTPLDEEDGGGFMAFAPDLRGCVGDGATPEEAVADLINAMKEWLDEAVRLKRKIPKPNSFSKRVAEERKNLRALVEAQSELVETQRKMILAAQAEVDQIKKQLEELCLPSNDEDYHGPVWISSGVVFPASTHIAKRRKASNLSH